MSRSSRSSSRARADKRRAVGHLGHRRGDRDVGLAVEVAAHVLDRLLEPQPDLGFFDLEPADPLAQLRELLLGLGPLGAQPVEPAPGGAGRLRLLLAPPAQPLGELLGLRSPAREPRRRSRRSHRACAPAARGAPAPALLRRAGPRAALRARPAGASSPDRRSSTAALRISSSVGAEPRAHAACSTSARLAASCSAAPASAVRASSSASTAARDPRARRPPGAAGSGGCAATELLDPARRATRAARRATRRARRPSRRSSAARCGRAASSSCRRRAIRFASRRARRGARGGEPLTLDLDRLRRGDRSRARRRWPARPRRRARRR